MKKSITLINGEVISYLKVGQGSKKIIMIHGNLTTGFIYMPILEELEKDYEIYIPDLRGFGDSSYFRKIKSIGDFSQDILFFMKALDINKSSFIGSGTGGAVVMDLASKHLEYVEKIILINSVTHSGLPIYLKDEYGKQALGQVHKSIDSLAMDLVDVIPKVEAFENKDRKYFEELFKERYFEKSDNDIEYFNTVVDEVLKQRNYVEVIWSLANFNLSHQHNFYAPGTNTINNIKNDVLHIWTDLDKVVPEYMISENVKAMLSNSKYIKYEGSGHLPFVDSNKQLIKDIKEFL